MFLHCFINTPVPSNTYLIGDEKSKECVLIDPGTDGCDAVIGYINDKSLIPKYILLTHGDFDHIWGVNALKEVFSSILLVASRETARQISIPQSYFSSLYFGKPEAYSINKTDIIIEDNGNKLEWNNNIFQFVQTPGHTSCSNIILFNDMLFSGDTILMDAKPYIHKRHGGNKEEYKESVKKILNDFSDMTIVYPGHGEKFRLGDVRGYYINYINQK